MGLEVSIGFIVKEEERKGVCSQAYLNQVLKPVIFSF
jgi:hypothetical protein